MGLKVENSIVIVDHSLSDHLETTRHKNPSVILLGEIPVHSVFLRKKNSAQKSANRNQKVIGDNCPLIYALKGKDELIVEFGSIKKLNEYIPMIIADICSEIGNEIDYIIPIPSSYGLGNILAKRLSRVLNREIIYGLFHKNTNAGSYRRAHNAIENNALHFAKNETILIKNAIKIMGKDPEGAYSAKTINTRIRKHFDPITLDTENFNKINSARFLFVDDLLATGETIKSAQRLLDEYGNDSKHHAVTWFSGIGRVL